MQQLSVIFISVCFMVMQLHLLLIRRMPAGGNASIRHTLQLKWIVRPSIPIEPVDELSFDQQPQQ